MTTRYFGAPIKRNEDRRLLTGRALFVDDVAFPNMAHAAFLRSAVAHGRIRRIDVEAARARPGVVAVYTAADLGSYWQPGPLLVPPPPIAGIIFNQRTQVPLARDKVRHVGEPLAVVIAESRQVAEDALADIAIDIEPLPAVVDLERALDAASASVHDDVRQNIAAHVRQTKRNYAAALAPAAHVRRSASRRAARTRRPQFPRWALAENSPPRAVVSRSPAPRTPAYSLTRQHALQSKHKPDSGQTEPLLHPTQPGLFRPPRSFLLCALKIPGRHDQVALLAYTDHLSIRI